jgi:DNA-directed RNA polymerase specialized sigma24 family protein
VDKTEDKSRYGEDRAMLIGVTPPMTKSDTSSSGYRHSDSPDGVAHGGRSARFVTTRWSMIAASRGNAERGSESLARLCQDYWFPLYAYVRRRGYSAEDAQDLTQAFFARLLEKNWVSGADRSKGRFRTFLLAAMTHFLADEWDRASARKRGGGAVLLSVSFDTAEARYVDEPADQLGVRLVFDDRTHPRILLLKSREHAECRLASANDRDEWHGQHGYDKLRFERRRSRIGQVGDDEARESRKDGNESLSSWPLRLLLGPVSGWPRARSGPAMSEPFRPSTRIFCKPAAHQTLAQNIRCGLP